MKRSSFHSGAPARTYWLSALVFGLIGIALALAASLSSPPQYEAHARLYVSTTGGAPVSNASYQEATASQQIALSLAKLISTEVITERVVRDMQLDLSPTELSSKVDATVEPETVLIDLSVTDTSPTAAREIVNGVALEFTDFVDELVLKKSTSVPKPQVTLIAPAATPDTPVSPNTNRNLGLGLAAGLALGLVFANVRERANKTIRDTDALDDVVGTPPLGRVGMSRTRSPKPIALIGRDRLAAEGFKEIRTNLVYALGSSPSRIVAVTSAGLREGKTTTVLGIATALADAGHRVVVVDADLRGRDLSDQLGLIDAPGLTEFLEEELAFDDVVYFNALHRVDAIPAGRSSSRSSELLASKTAEKMYRLLGERYDFVIVDTPAVLAYTDAAVVAGRSDGVIVVARYAGVVSADLASAVESLRKVQARILGSILTFAPISEPRRRGVSSRGAGQAPRRLDVRRLRDLRGA